MNKFKRFASHVNPKQTKELFSNDKGEYTEERQLLHLKIVNDFMLDAHAPIEGQIPVGILLGGGSASGKSKLLKSIVIPELKNQKVTPIIVDADLMKTYIPEYKLYKKTCKTEAASLVHKESKDMAGLLLKHVIQRRLHFVLESTLAQTDKIKKLITSLRKEGYSVHLYIVDAPVHIAIIRSDQRGKKTGRYIPHEVIRQSHKMVPRTFEAIKHRVDSFQLYENTKGLQLFASNASIKNLYMYRAFLRKGLFRDSNQIKIRNDRFDTNVTDDFFPGCL